MSDLDAVIACIGRSPQTDQSMVSETLIGIPTSGIAMANIPCTDTTTIELVGTPFAPKDLKFDIVPGLVKALMMGDH